MGVAIERFSPREQEKLRAAGRAAAATLAYVGSRIRAGVSTLEIDRWVRDHTRKLGGTPSQLGYKGFPAAVCTSRNQVVCHGIPTASERLASGDIINVDVTTCLDGFHGDTSATFTVGAVSREAEHLVEVARRCLQAGIGAVRGGGRLGGLHGGPRIRRPRDRPAHAR